MGLFKSKTSFIPRKNRNGTTTAGQYSQYGISQSSNGGTSSQKEDLSDIYKRLEEKLDSNKVGTANGAASLDENGKVPTSQLPSYVDDVVEYATRQEFPIPGESGKIYIDTSTNKTYRWGGTTYVDITSSSDDCLPRANKITDEEIGRIVAGSDVESADNYINNRGLKSLWAYITAAANDIVTNLSAMIAAKQDAISVTTKSDTPTGNDTVIMQANGTNNTKTFLRRKLSDLWNFFKTQPYGEAYLSWGGKNFAAGYSPIDASMIGSLGANRTAFIPGSGITVEYSRDGGATWNDYGLTDSQKTAIFSVGGDAIIGKSSLTEGNYPDSNCQLRIIINTAVCHVYSTLNKFAIYLSTNGSKNCVCSIDILRKDRFDNNDYTWTSVASNVTVGGWSGWNVINVSGFTTYGNTTSQYQLIKFTFSCGECSTSYSGLSIQIIKCFGGVGWVTPSNEAKYGTLYREDASQSAIFPNSIYVGNSTDRPVYSKGGADVAISDGGTGASTAIGAEYNILNQVQDIDATLNDNRKIALCNENKSSTNGVFRWLKMSNVWNYIKGKIDTAYSAVLVSGITSGKVSSYDTHIADGNKHTTSAEKATWNGKADAVHTHTKGQVGLGNVDNTSDADKPISTAQQAALNNLETEIQGKANSSHTHNQSQITGLSSALSDKANDNAVVHLAGGERITGVKTFTREVIAEDGVYGTANNTNYGSGIRFHYEESEDGSIIPMIAVDSFEKTSGGGSTALHYVIGGKDASNKSCINGRSNILPSGKAIYEALQEKVGPSDLSEYYKKTDTVEKAKKANSADFASASEEAQFDSGGNEIVTTYLKKAGGTMSGDINLSDCSIKTNKLSDGQKLIEYANLVKTSTQPYTGRNLIGANGGNADKIQTIIRSGGDLIHRRGNDVTKEDAVVIDSTNASEQLDPIVKGKAFNNGYACNVDSAGHWYLLGSADVADMANMDYSVTLLITNGYINQSAEAGILKIHARNNNIGVIYAVNVQWILAPQISDTFKTDWFRVYYQNQSNKATLQLWAYIRNQYSSYQVDVLTEHSRATRRSFRWVCSETLTQGSPWGTGYVSSTVLKIGNPNT